MNQQTKPMPEPAGVRAVSATMRKQGSFVPLPQETATPPSGVLIINADDWGRDRENTSRTLDCIRYGTVSSVSSMVFMEDSERAAAIARELAIDAGLHLNFTTSFSGLRVPRRLIEHQEHLSRCLLRHRLAQVVFYPWLTRSFEYVVAAQIDEFCRLYGAKPGRVDGHHHMHLCANVLFGKLLPEGAIVRRNFSFQPGEKSLYNRLYRDLVDRMLAQRHRLADYFFALDPLDCGDRLRRIFSFAHQSVVEIETHPVNPDEYRFLHGGEIVRQIANIPIASHFTIERFPQITNKPDRCDVLGRMVDYEQLEESEGARTDASCSVVQQASAGHRRFRPTVLVGFAEAAAAAEVVWSLVDEGCDVIAFARKGRSSALRHSRHVICYDICAPESNLQEAVADLRTLMASVKTPAADAQPVLFPLDDKAVLLASTLQLADDWILAGPDGTHAELALNKCLQIEAARRAGFNVPNTAVARTVDDIRSFIAAESYPIILKSAECVPIEGGRANAFPQWICADDSELGRALGEWRERVSLLVQPFIAGTGEGLFGLAAPEGIRGWSAHRRLRMMNPQGSGSSACISQSVSEDLQYKAENFVKQTGWRGMFMIELLRDHSGKAFFVEFNGRPWGSMALSRRQHFEYPAWQIRLAIDPDSQVGLVTSSVPGVVCRHAARELMHLLIVLRGPKSKALNEWPSFWKSMTDVVRFRPGETFYNWRRGDPKVFIADVCYAIKNSMFKTNR